MSSCACSVSLRFGPRFSVCIPLFWPSRAAKPSQASSSIQQEETPLLSANGSGTHPLSQGARYVMYGAFTLMGLALSLLWGSISFQASIYNELFGMETWALMIVVYNAPGLLSLLFQLFTDDIFEV